MKVAMNNEPQRLIHGQPRLQGSFTPIA